MKTGIVTMYNPMDYGNRLQNYAMHRVLSGLGLECETLVPRQPKKTSYRRGREKFVRKTYDADPADAQQKSPEITRQIRFEEFACQYMPMREIDSVNFPPAVATDYQWLVTGGDSVWNPGIRENLGKIDNCLLSFAKSSQRVCMAPSLGGAEVPQHMRELYHAQWNKFPWLNVRSQEDACWIREITGRKAETMMDPILMVEGAHWHELIKPLPDFDEQDPYCLVWLDSHSGEGEKAEAILTERFPNAPQRRCSIGAQGDAVVDSAGPCEFLYLMKHASVLLTDSYYGAVFAVQLGTPFVYVAGPEADAERNLVERMLELLEVSSQSAGECIWSNQITTKNIIELPDWTNSMELLKKMFRLDAQKSEEEVSRL